MCFARLDSALMDRTELLAENKSASGKLITQIGGGLPRNGPLLKE